MPLSLSTATTGGTYNIIMPGYVKRCFAFSLQISSSIFLLLKFFFQSVLTFSDPEELTFILAWKPIFSLLI